MPSSVFNSREELMEGCKDWSATQGYAIVIARSRFNRLWLKCDRGGTYENRRNLTPDQRKRKRGDSRLLGCPFKMIAACKKDGSWMVDTEIPEHNHEPSGDLSAHPTLRRMTDQQLQKVHDMCDAGKSPAETLEELRSLWPDIKVLTRDIYNARKKYKTQKEEAEAAAGLPREQPYQDPNELGFNGPSPNGRWAWVPDGEEVTNKKLKKKRKSVPAALPASHPVLDPQLRTPVSSHTSSQPAPAGQTLQNGLIDPHGPAAQLRVASQQADTRIHSATNNPQGTPSTNITSLPSSHRQDSSENPAPHPYNPPSHSPDRQTPMSPSREHPQTQPPNAPTAPMSSTRTPAALDTSATSNYTKPGEVKAQVLMSRIERMEKEQRDQKNMLTQILGAVQGIRGSPGEEISA